MWASGLVSWHLARHPTSWTPPQGLPESTQTLISQASSVVASALHTTAVAHSMDTPDGSRLLAVPLAAAAELLSVGRALDTLSSSAPPDSAVAALLQSVRAWLDEGDNTVRGQGEFVIERAHDVLTAHAESGYALGDRVRAVLEVNYAVDNLP